MKPGYGKIGEDGLVFMRCFAIDFTNYKTKNMNKMKTCFFTLLALFSLTITNAQTADEIIAKHIDAIGGKDKLSQINSVYMESTTSVMGTDAATKTYIVNGKAYRNESDFNGQTLVQVVTDSSGWEINPFTGATSATAMADDVYQSRAGEIYAVDPLVDYAANGGKVELAGQEQTGDVNAYKLKYTNKYNKETVFYIDPATWYIIKTVSTANVMGQEATVTSTLSNYQKTDFGTAMPYALNVDMGQFALAVTVQKVEMNKTIDPTIFDMPKQ